MLDLACGTGAMTWLLTGRGYELIAVDGSEDMLAAAMGKSGTVEGVAPIFLHQSMPKLDLYGTVDAAICCLDSLNYLTRPADVQRTFQRLHLFIAPGGLLVFDINTVEKLAALDGQVFLDETEDTYCVWRTEYRRGLCTYYVDLFRQQERRRVGSGAGDPPPACLYRGGADRAGSEGRPDFTRYPQPVVTWCSAQSPRAASSASHFTWPSDK